MGLDFNFASKVAPGLRVGEYSVSSLLIQRTKGRRFQGLGGVIEDNRAMACEMTCQTESENYKWSYCKD